MKSEEDIDEEAKEALMKHGRFLACMLEKQDMVTIALTISIYN